MKIGQKKPKNKLASVQIPPDPVGSRPNRKLQPEKGRYVSLWMVLMLFFFLEALGYVWCRVQCVNTGFIIDRETKRYQHLVKTRNLLKVEHALLKSPERIETIARTRLDLTLPDADQTLILP
ncbi:cell division protein FtsL [Desulfosarcina sp. OttesenSCG-928-A07]|nr:cell division protein FtsL [Desulfosarcina sp. OttesenSCG-928-A07]